MFRQVVEGLRHLFEVEYLGPAGIPVTFPGLEFVLDVHQQIDLGRDGLRGGLFAGRMLLLAGKNCQQIVQREPSPSRSKRTLLPQPSAPMEMVLPRR